jgi:hypothetical protein
MVFSFCKKVHSFVNQIIILQAELIGQLDSPQETAFYPIVKLKVWLLNYSFHPAGT